MIGSKYIKNKIRIKKIKTTYPLILKVLLCNCVISSTFSTFTKFMIICFIVDFVHTTAELY